MKPSKELVDLRYMAQQFMADHSCLTPSHCHNGACRGSGACLFPHLLLAEFGALVARECAEIAKQRYRSHTIGGDAGRDIAEAILAKYVGKE